MRNQRIRRAAALMLMLILLVSTASAETVRGNLVDRFSDIVRVEYEGKNYSMRNRLSAVLAMAVDTNELGLKLVDFARVLIVDDADKVFSMIDIPGNTLVQVAASNESELSYMRFGDVYQLEDTPQENCRRLLDAVNRLLGWDVVESFIAFDLEGGPILTGGEPLEGTTIEKLHVLREIVDEKTTEELNDTYALLGDHIVTDMKSGAVMKIIDKADRYERSATIPLPGEVRRTANNGPVTVVGADALQKIVISLFFKKSIW